MKHKLSKRACLKFEFLQDIKGNLWYYQRSLRFMSLNGISSGLKNGCTPHECLPEFEIWNAFPQQFTSGLARLTENITWKAGIEQTHNNIMARAGRSTQFVSLQFSKYSRHAKFNANLPYKLLSRLCTMKFTNTNTLCMKIAVKLKNEKSSTLRA